MTDTQRAVTPDGAVPATAEPTRYRVEDDEVVLERVRLDHLAACRDPRTFACFDRLGVGPGWRCLEVGAGAGSVSAWLGERVAPSGSVLSTDIDLRFHRDMPSTVEVRRHDVVADPLPSGKFDLVHARAVLQHVPWAEALDALVDALAPSGSIVLEDGDFLAFAEQTLPEPYATVHRLICAGVTTAWRDPTVAVKLVQELRARGLVDLDVEGDVWAMRPGEPGGEWWFLAVERAGPRLVEAGLVTAAQVDEALAQVRAPGFVMLSTLALTVTGAKSASRP